MNSNDDNENVLGTLISNFYVELRELQNKLQIENRESNSAINSKSILNPLLFSLQSIEDYKENDTADILVIDEIIDDCRKKVSQVLRNIYGENIRTLITVCRKNLNSKANNNENTSQYHGQRHLNSLIDLLGSWSNTILELNNLGLSSQVLILTISLFHTRIIEVAVDCFHKFKDDKNLDKLSIRIGEYQSNHKDNLKYDQDLNLMSLDLILSQMSAMRDVVNKYYYFLLSITSSDNNNNNNNNNNSNNNNSNNNNNNNSNNYYYNNNNNSNNNNSNNDVNKKKIEKSEIIDKEERRKWKELDAVYVALEYGYFGLAIDCALSDYNLVEVEKGSVFIPQSVEDSLFILQKISNRAISTGSEHSILAIGNKIIELLEPELESVLYNLLMNKISYIDSFYYKSVRPPNGRSIQNKVIQNNNNIVKSNSNIEISIGKELGIDGIDDVANSIISSDSFIGNAVGAGVNYWYGNSKNNSNTNLNQIEKSNSKNNLIPLIPPKSNNLNELIINALVENSEFEDEFQVNKNLSIEDYCIHLNSLSVSVISLEKLLDTFEIAHEDILIIAKTSSISMIINEISKCVGKLKIGYHNIIKEFVGIYFEDRLIKPIRQILSRSYLINGELYERYSGDEDIATCVNECLGVEGFAVKEIKSKLSHTAFTEVLKCVILLICEILINCIKSSQFSEWGSLLLQQEVRGLLSTFENIATEFEFSIHVLFESLLWYLKILTIDDPSYISRYSIPKSLFIEEDVRKILHCRVDLSKEAISKVKLNIS